MDQGKALHKATQSLEIKRNEKLIGSSLQAQVVIFLESEILNNVKISIFQN